MKEVIADMEDQILMKKVKNQNINSDEEDEMNESSLSTDDIEKRELKKQYLKRNQEKYLI